MQDDDTTTKSPTARGTRTALKVALVGAGVIAGAIGATAIGANATTTGSGSTTGTTTSTSSTSSTSGTESGTSGTTAPANDHDGDGSRGGGGNGGQNPNETVIASTDPRYNTLVDAAKAAIANDSALKSLTITKTKVETDSGDAKFEVHLTLSDGSEHTVKFDANLKFVNVEDGMGK